MGTLGWVHWAGGVHKRGYINRWVHELGYTEVSTQTGVLKGEAQRKVLCHEAGRAVKEMGCRLL